MLSDFWKQVMKALLKSEQIKITSRWPVPSSLYVWWTSWSINSRGIFVSGPYSLHALLSKAATICFTTSSKNNVASWECRSERNSKEIEKSKVQVLG